MSAPITAPAGLLRPAPAAPAAVGGQAEIDKTAKDFEAAFLSSMLATLFENVEASPPFGGGHAETTLKSFLTDAFAGQITRAGGVGLADHVGREMLKLQGLT